MQLTSGYLLFTVVASFLLLNIIVIVKWSKFKRIYAKILALLLINLMGLLGAGLYLNNANSLYNSWSELFGIENTQFENIKPTSIDLNHAKITPNGSAIVEKIFTGSTSKVTSSVWYLIPKGIVEAIRTNSEQKYPVVYFLSGSPGVPTAWLHGLDLDNQIKAVKDFANLPDFIAVLPEINVIPRKDTECMNIPGVANTEDWLAKDIYEYTINNLPAQNNNWLVTGYSTGGWCSAMLALRHPEVFKAAAPIAGFFKTEVRLGLSAKIRENLSTEYDLISIAHNSKQQTDFYLVTSKVDRSTYESTEWFYKTVGAGHNVDLLTLKDGGHNFSTWKPIVQDILKWFIGEIK
jgi:enterochelin esterase-like enzyme